MIQLGGRPTPKLEVHPLSAVRDCLFNLFAAALHIGGLSSNRNLRTRHAVVTGTHKHGNIYIMCTVYYEDDTALRMTFFTATLNVHVCFYCE